MKRMTLRTFGALGLVLGLSVAALRADVIEQVLVKVNGEILTKTDVEQLQVTALRASNPNITAADLQNDVALRKMLDEVTPRVIVNAIDELLLVQRGRELGLKMSDEQFNGILANIRKENKLDTEEKFQAALKQEGLTIPGLRKAFEKQMLINRVQQQDVFSRISISEEESRAYFDAHKEEFLTNESVTLRELFVRAATTAPAEGPAAAQAAMAAAREKIEQIRQRVLKEDFATVAGEVSDAASKANGGLIGPLGVDELNPDIQKVLADAEGRAGVRAARCRQRLSPPQAGRACAEEAGDVRGSARPDCGQGLQPASRRRSAEVPRASARPGDHRVEEPVAEGRLRHGRGPGRQGHGRGSRQDAGCRAAQGRLEPVSLPTPPPPRLAVSRHLTRRSRSPPAVPESARLRSQRPWASRRWPA